MNKVIKLIKTHESLFGTRSDIKLRKVQVRGSYMYQVVRGAQAWLFDTLSEAEKCFAEQVAYDNRRYKERATLHMRGEK